MVCPCMLGGIYSGGYKATLRNRKLLRKYKQGVSIGFTARSSLKAKGLIPRANGHYIISPKYSGTGKHKNITHKHSVIKKKSNPIKQTRKYSH